MREAYIDNNRVIVNDLNQDSTEGNTAKIGKSVKNMTFFTVVKEAVMKEKGKKERPSLLKFLEKFERIEIPESVTPNPYETFSHFEEAEGPEDEDLKTLKASLTRVSGTCRELAAPRVRDVLNVQKCHLNLILGILERRLEVGCRQHFWEGIPNEDETPEKIPNLEAGKDRPR